LANAVWRPLVRLLLVEDDNDLGDATQHHLRRTGIEVDWIKDGRQANKILKRERYDVICLDLGLPGTSGLDVLRALRSRGDLTPILILTAHGAVEDRVNALDIGADDYLLKPFDLRELKARLRALTRRVQGTASEVTTIGTLTIDRGARSVYIGDQKLSLPNREYRLLEIFIGNLDRALSREQIFAKMFNFDDKVGGNALEVYVGRLRRKLGDAMSIRTMYGYGYIAQIPAHERSDATASGSDDG